jgi:hypothetical protein
MKNVGLAFTHGPPMDASALPTSGLWSTEAARAVDGASIANSSLRVDGNALTD